MKKRSCLSLILKIVGGFLLLLTILLAGTAIYNQTLPNASSEVEQLSEQELARIQEINHLRNTLGDNVWPGWSSLDIPILLYNEEYAFLTGLREPSPGWVRVPYGIAGGGTWEQVSGETYYRQTLPDNGNTPQAFIVRIGDTYAASMTTKEWTGIHLAEIIQDELPGFLAPVFPYFIFTSRFNSDWFVSAVLHESFHVLQARFAYKRLKQAEQATTFEEEYPWGDDDFRSQWLKEREKLAEALVTEDSLRRQELVQQWTSLRKERREVLTDELIRYEQQREWLEGLAKYAELSIWAKAAGSPSYKPVASMKSVPDFNAYREYGDQRKQEISQLKSDMQFSESMFYYTGWAQAELLDQLRTNWKKEVMNTEVFLDELLTRQ